MVDPFHIDTHFVLWLAKHEAMRQSKDAFGSEHLLLALIRPYCMQDSEKYFEYANTVWDKILADIEPQEVEERPDEVTTREWFCSVAKVPRMQQGIAHRTFEKHPVCLSEARKIVDELSPSKTRDQINFSNLHETHGCKRLIQKARHLARPGYKINSGHLLLAVLDSRGVVRRILDALKINREAVRATTLQLMESENAGPS